MSKSRAFLLSVPLLAAALVALAPPAAAHDHVMVDDTYEFTIGWIHEPPYVDQPNGVWLRVLGPAPELKSPLFEPGESFSHTFYTTGTVAYHCHPHPWMKGNVTVVDAGRKTPETHHVRVIDGPEIDDQAFVPENLVIAKGDTVVWTIDEDATMAHQVMADSAMHDHEGHDTHAHEETETGHGHEEESDDGHGHGHGHSAVAPVAGVDQTLQVEVSIAGKSETFSLSPMFGEPGVYVARFVPTVSGTYTAHFTGKVGDSDVDVTTDLQRVEALDDVQFPEATGDAFALKKQLDAQAKEIAALKAQLDTQAATPADVDTAGGADTPFVGLAALVAVGVVAATLMRRRA